ncbi:hypothetical protein FQR65_LT18300 [Abscondita terminalis]|nr:hypothetical protein FQR65_LT18300 [Abscondita terminalis]
MRLGLLLLWTLVLGIVLGLLLGVQVFRVFQNAWEIKRLRKDIDHLRKEQIQTAQLAAAEAAANARHEKTLDPSLCRLKVGKELFTHEGPSVVKALHDKGFEVFLDLKFHDIPNTTAQAVCAAADLGVWMVNVHASGGRKMMETCVERLKAESVLGGTPLKDSGLDGVVCSAQEAKMLRQELGAEFALVTPGIRPAGANADDQKRIVTPKQAMLDGSTHLVIGRPITQSENPSQTLQDILATL